MLFEIQLLKSKETDEEFVPGQPEVPLVKPPIKPTVYSEFENQLGVPEFSREEPKDRRGSQNLRSILLKGEMRYLKDGNLLVFLCSPL